MKEFEITSCLPNLEREQGITILGLLRIQPFTPTSTDFWRLGICPCCLKRFPTGMQLKAIGFSCNSEYSSSEIDFTQRGHPTDGVIRGRVLSAHIYKLKVMITITQAPRFAVFYPSRFFRLPGHFVCVAWAHYGLLRN